MVLTSKWGRIQPEIQIWPEQVGRELDGSWKPKIYRKDAHTAYVSTTTRKSSTHHTHFKIVLWHFFPGQKQLCSVVQCINRFLGAFPGHNKTSRRFVDSAALPVMLSCIATIFTIPALHILGSGEWQPAEISHKHCKLWRAHPLRCYNDDWWINFDSLMSGVCILIEIVTMSAAVVQDTAQVMAVKGLTHSNSS